MGGLAILLIVVFYIALAVWLVVRVVGWRRKTVVGLIAFLLPTADGYLGRKYVEHLCAKDGGLKIYRVVEGVEGVLGLAPDSSTLKRTGYRFIEYAGSFSDPQRAIRRIEQLPNGEVVESFDANPRASYQTRKDTVFRGLLTTGVAYDDYLVIERRTGESLARYREYRGGAGWAERFLGQFTGAGGAGGIECPRYGNHPGYEKLLLLVLKPTSLN
jgi:hypothetical protein